MNDTALAVRSEEMMFMPVMDMHAAIARRNHVVEFVQKIMKEGTDFGKIPGAGDKPTLLKPGAEKLSTFFGLTPIFIPVTVVEDWTGDDHKGEAFFYYRYRCELHRNGLLVASSEGSCNTWESKYRYRKAERVCPDCGQATIIKGKPEYGGGWLCYKAKGGCGSKFSIGDQAIEGQQVGRVMNPDVADIVNTVQKMAQKRALIAATLLAVNASEFFTQDIEDMVIEAEWRAVEPEPQKQAQNATSAKKAQHPAESANASQGASVPASGDESEGTPPHTRCFGVGLSVFGPAWQNGGRKWFLKFWSKHATPDNVRDSLSDFSDDEKTLIADYLEENRTKLQRAWQKYEAEKVAA